MRQLILSLVVAVAMAVCLRPALASPEQWRAEGWTRTDFSKTSVDLAGIRSGGPPKDGIPPIDRPMFQPHAAVTDIAANEPVISLELNGEAKAYPLRILMWHEIANDVVGGTPVAVTYCPLCNAALVFDRRSDGVTLDFGTTGKLRNSDLVMYDRQSESWWQQFTGEAITGAMTGRKLTLIPSRLESFGEFKLRHSDGQVLMPPADVARDYGRNPYVGYDTLARPFLYDGALPQGIEPMAHVVVVRENGVPALAVTLEKLRKAEALEVAGFALSWKKGQSSALDSSRIAEGRDIGSIIARKAGQDMVYDVTFAFVVHAFHPDLAIMQ